MPKGRHAVLSRDRIFTTDDKVNNDRDEVPYSSASNTIKSLLKDESLLVPKKEDES